MVNRVWYAALVAGLGLAPVAVHASPADTVWVEDIHLHPSGPAELATVYEYQQAPSEVLLGDGHKLTLRSSAGFDRAPVDFQPSIGLAQLAGGGAIIDHVGLRARYLAVGSRGQPVVAVIVGYQVLPQVDLAHQLEQTVAARWQRGTLSLVGELGFREQLGGTDRHVELRIAAGVTREFLIDYIRLGIEVFSLAPLVGQRISDYGLGDDGDQLSLYLGPSLRMNFESMWLSVGIATGAILDAGSSVTVRAVLATQF